MLVRGCYYYQDSTFSSKSIYMTLRFPNTYQHSLNLNKLIIIIPSLKSKSSASVWRRQSPRMDFTINRRQHHRRKEKVVVIMGATGTGKSRLSIDLATRFFPSSEIINSDKIQVYRGLDITTNKIPIHERRGVAHHLLGDIDFGYGDFSASDYRLLGSSVISDITSRRKTPFLVGGSNSFIHALMTEKFDPGFDPFIGSGSVSSELRYNCCFIWVDISASVLSEYLDKRVDDMINSGMLNELSEFYDPESKNDKTGIRKAIGVPEFDRYFEKYPPEKCRKQSTTAIFSSEDDVATRRELYEKAVKEIKDNTCQLAKRQIGKILRLRGGGWELKRVDATSAVRAAMTSDSGEKWEDCWEKQVMEPSVKIVKRFLDG